MERSRWNGFAVVFAALGVAVAVAACPGPRGPEEPQLECPDGHVPNARGRCVREECRIPGPGCGDSPVLSSCGARTCVAGETCFSTTAGVTCGPIDSSVCGPILCARGEVCAVTQLGTDHRCLATRAADGGRLSPELAELCGTEICGNGETCMENGVGTFRECVAPGSEPCGLTICTPEQHCVRDPGPEGIQLDHCEG